jgi:hypothetical protein
MRTLCSFPIFTSLLFSSLLFAEPKGETGGSAVKERAPQAAVSSCRFSGVATPEFDVSIVNQKGGALARFGGVALPLTVSDLPEQASGLLHVTTGGKGRLSIDGYVEVKSLPLYVTTDVSVSEGYLTIAKGTRVEFVGATGDKLRVKLALLAPLNESYTVTVPCSAIALEQPKNEAWKVPGHARGYYMKSPSAPLFDVPGAKATPVATLHLSPDARGILFFGDRREGEFIHVLYRREVKIDGWMSVKDLELLPKGELVDQRSNRPANSQASRLTVASDARLVRTTSDLPLYGKADPKIAPIGTVAKDTELFVLDVVVGWANVLPKQLDVVPMTERRFWVRASELGL